MSLYTDLALEAREMNPDINGVKEETESFSDITVTRISVENEEAAEKLGKRMGRYVTIDAPALIDRPPELFAETSNRVAAELKSLLGGLERGGSLLEVGLGNRAVTPDSLGPRTAGKLFVTRHVKEYMPDVFGSSLPSVASIAPGVLGSTGVETLEIIKGVADRIKPDAVIAIDSLASRRAARIFTTIQLSDAGIDPGAGVGNLRAGLNAETLGVPVIAIGVPLVVCASTITSDAISMIAEEAGIRADEEKIKALADKAAAERMDGMIVTPKEIDGIVSDMSGILAEGVNRALFGGRFDEVRTLIA